MICTRHYVRPQVKKEGVEAFTPNLESKSTKHFDHLCVHDGTSISACLSENPSLDTRPSHISQHVSTPNQVKPQILLQPWVAIVFCL